MFDRAKFWRYTRYTVLTVALLAAGFTLYLDFRVRGEFEGRRFALPARIYARPLELHAGLRIAQIDVVREGTVMARYPLLIQKVLADKLSDKVQVIIAPPSADGSLVGAVLGGKHR